MDTSPTKFAHIVLRTPNAEAMCRFYCTLLNATVAFANPVVSFLRYDDEHHRIAIVNTPSLKADLGPRAGLEHFAFTYDSLGDVLANYRRLRAAGIEPVWCINHGMTTSIYYADPDGNQVEIQYDNMDMADADKFMCGTYFAKNPIGVDFDPELLIARYLRGDAIAELTKQGSARPSSDQPHRVPPGVPPYDWRGELIQ